MKTIRTRFRLLRRIKFRYLRLFLYSLFRLWLKQIYYIERLPDTGPCIIVSNHTSYVDWIILSSIYREKYLVFLGNKELHKRPVVNWLMKLNVLIYISPDNPGYSYFREVVWRLKKGHVVVIYPEGTRSKSGRMIEPKLGFVKLAISTGVPIVPIGLKGAYEILPPNKSLPKLRRCEVFVGEKIIINKDNPLFKDIFEKDAGRISKKSMGEIAFRIMDIIRNVTGQEWDGNITWKPSDEYSKYLPVYLSRVFLRNK